MNNIQFAGVTSAAGGSGTTSLCICLARILTRLGEGNEPRILCLSLDALSSKMAPKKIEKKSVKRLLTRLVSDSSRFKEIADVCISKDEFGVAYFADPSFYNPLNRMNSEDLMGLLSAISQSELFDLVIMDIPFSSCYSMQQCSCCEKLVVLKGYLPKQQETNERLYGSIEKYIKSLSERPELYSFAPLIDTDSFTLDEPDLHGQYAAEVRELAAQLFTFA